MDTRSNIPAEVNNFYNKTLLMRVVPLFVYNKWAQTKDITQNAGTSTAKFRRYSSLAAATTPLTEGVTPAGSSLTVTDITAVCQQYGDYLTVTDVVQYESVDPVLTEYAEILGDQAVDTIDQVTRDILLAGTNVYYGGAAVARSGVGASDLITTTLIDKTVRLLKRNKARKITKIVDASTGIGTKALNASYIGIIHPDVSYTLKTLTGFVKVEDYANKSDVMEGEIGYYGEVRFIETTNAKVFTGAGSGSIDVYGTIIFGAEAYGISRISGKSLENIVKPIGSGGTSDPLNQRATSGWKATHVAKILNNDFLVRIETAAAA